MPSKALIEAANAFHDHHRLEAFGIHASAALAADVVSVLRRVLTTDTIFELAALPHRIAVIGMGAVGIEMAQALARLGIEVTAFSQGDMLAGLTYDKGNASLRALLAQEFAIPTGADVELSAAPNGVLVHAGAAKLEVVRVLGAIGRTSNVDDMGLASLGVPLRRVVCHLSILKPPGLQTCRRSSQAMPTVTRACCMKLRTRVTSSLTMPWPKTASVFGDAHDGHRLFRPRCRLCRQATWRIETGHRGGWRGQF